MPHPVRFLCCAAIFLAGGAMLNAADSTKIPTSQPASSTHTPATDQTIPRAAKPPRIDGELDDPQWQHAAVIGPFVGPLNPGDGDVSKLPEYWTEARLLWDPDHLYVAFICKGGDALTDRTQHNDELYKQDVSEVFLDVVGDMTGYVELQANPKNATGSYLHDWSAVPTYPADKLDWGQMKNHKTDNDWKPEGFEVASKPIVADGKTAGWIVEWAIPMAQILKHRGLDPSLRENQKIKANLFRYEYPPSPLDKKGQRVLHQFNWSPTMQGCPHVSPMAMKTIVLGA